jgi:hypothetical protein
MTIHGAIATLERRLAYVTRAREAWCGSGAQQNYAAAGARLDMLRLQLDKLARAVLRADLR